VYVKCRTSDAAVVKLSVDEIFDIRMRVQNSTCEVLDMSVIPRGEIGRLVMRLVGFPDQIKEAAARQIKTLCG
jgi:hypothetical protein